MDLLPYHPPMKRTGDSRMMLMVLSLALAGLTAVLSVLLHGAWRAERQAHDRSVQAALTATVKKLEADEISAHAVKFIVAGDESALGAGSRKFMLGHSAPASAATVVFRDSIQVLHAEGGSGAKALTQESKVAVFARLDSTRSESRRDLAWQLVTDIVGLRPQDITERLATAGVDSVLQANLVDLGITVRPRFAVVETDSGRTVLSNLQAAETMPETGVFRARLFPLDFSAPRYDLVVDLPGARARILARVWPLGAASAAFLLVTALSFGQVHRALGRQRRAADHLVAFINNMTHEFKTPLATVSLACEALARRSPDADTGRYLTMIRQENDRLGGQVEKILQMAQLERGELVRGDQQVDLGELCSRRAAAFSLQAEQKSGRIVVHLPGRPVTMTADPHHLSAILDNLLDNAVKYGGEAPQVELDFSLKGDGRTAEAVVEVSDRGPGIARADQDRVFEPYFRCAVGDRHDVRGYGLGLSFVKLLAELYGGRVGLESSPGSGTKVMVSLPLDQGVGGEERA